MDTDWDLVDAAMHNGAAPSSIRAQVNSASKKQPQDEQAKRDERNMQIAMHHATLLQQRKDVEAGILKSTIALIDFPTSESADPAHPASADASAVKDHLRHFQPNDYDELVQERNIEKKCGYVLCPRPYREDHRNGKFTILHKHRDIKIVKTKDLKRWCSEGCARRAMYIRVQLNDTPAWERQGSDRLQLYEEDDDADAEAASQSQAVAKMTADLKKLALERGHENVDKLMTDFQNMAIPHR